MKKKRETNFLKFLREFRVVTAAIGFIFALITNELVQSFVNNLIMPFLDPLIKDGTWQTATLAIGAAQIKWGAFLSTFLRFIIIGVLVYVIIKKILRYSPAKS
jgi:large conductance mechanosensitive channel